MSSVFLRDSSKGAPATILREISLKGEVEKQREVLIQMMKDFGAVMNSLKANGEHASTPRSKDDFEETIKHLIDKKGKLFFLMLNETVIGYAMIIPSNLLGQREIYLSQYYISPSFRSQGYGSIFLEKLIALAKSKGYKNFLLGVLEGNKPAIELYKRVGFTINSYNMVRSL